MSESELRKCGLGLACVCELNTCVWRARRYVHAESETRKIVADFVAIHFSSLSLVALALGILLKLVLNTDVSVFTTQARLHARALLAPCRRGRCSIACAQVFIAVFLGISSFWVMLDVDGRELWRNKKARIRTDHCSAVLLP